MWLASMTLSTLSWLAFSVLTERKREKERAKKAAKREQKKLAAKAAATAEADPGTVGSVVMAVSGVVVSAGSV